jgi:hypothetical protein
MPTKAELQAEIDRLKKKLAEYQPEYATEDGHGVTVGDEVWNWCAGSSGVGDAWEVEADTVGDGGMTEQREWGVDTCYSTASAACAAMLKAIKKEEQA